MKSGCLYEWVIWIICSAVSFKKYWGMNSLNKGTSQIDGCLLVLSWIAWQSQCQLIFGELESENIAYNWRMQTINDASFNTGRMKNTKQRLGTKDSSNWDILKLSWRPSWRGGLTRKHPSIWEAPYSSSESLGAFPLQIYAKLWQNVINID